MLLDIQQPARSIIMTEEKQLAMDLLSSKTKRGLRLNDSLEYYKQKDILRKSDSPPPSSPLSLTMIDDEEESDDDSLEERGHSQFTSFKVDWDEEEDDDIEAVERELAEDDEDDEADLYVPRTKWNYDDDIEFTKDSDDDIQFTSDVEVTDDDEIVIEEPEEEEPHFVEVPFWFGSEDPDQIQCILAKYTTALQLDEEIKRCIRMPPPFIGRVKRSVVHAVDNFMTLDEVEIFRRSMLPPFSQLPFVKKRCLLSTWNIEDGIQTHCRQVSKADIREMENSRDFKIVKESKEDGKSTSDDDEASGKPREISYLMAYPNYAQCGFQYEESRASREVTSPKTNGNNSNFYGKFIPPELLHRDSNPDDNS
eukprot:TRINITY_DN753_c0_g1_i1.p1 TRINITY_DN753_c0_g1~~TRINITY_DN753_c0_g1_i1.p1  ORF type:complete len:366 (-),score=111.10 TRINITY_DN753_c0_g1_i1:63-1160(-)